MKLSIQLHPFRLSFRHPFRIAHGVRNFTEVVFAEQLFEGQSIVGEAALPPYRDESGESVRNFFNHLQPIDINPDFDIPVFMDELDAAAPGNYAAKAALDMLLWRLKAAINKIDLPQYFHSNTPHLPLCSYTIGICNQHEMPGRIKAGIEAGFKLFKLKLDGTNDAERIGHFRANCDLPFGIDANGSWSSLIYAEQLLPLLERSNCILIEQPFGKSDWSLHSALSKMTALPVIADESIQTIADLERACESFTGVNIKLMKCGGMSHAVNIIRKLKHSFPSMKILIGCMSESACGCSMAAHLAPFADWVDLDGPWLVSNDPFEMPELKNGKWVVADARLLNQTFNLTA